MEFYNEARDGALREVIEGEVLTWPQVGVRRMFGCPAYVADGRLFAFLVTGGLVITQLRKAERAMLAERYETEPFKVGEREIERWIRVHIPTLNLVDYALHFVRRSYEIALAQMK